MYLTWERNRKFVETQNLIELTELSTSFSKKLVIFENLFWPIKKICVNLNFNKLNDVIFEKYLHQFKIHSIFLHIFYF
jgi:hypothetical protein